MESLEAVMRDYVAAVTGVAGTGREQARQLALRLVDSGAAGAEQVGDLADDIATTAASARSRLVSLVRTEADAAVARVEARRQADLARLNQRLGDLEGQIASLRRQVADVTGPTGAVEPPTQQVEAATPDASPPDEQPPEWSA